MRSLPGFHPPQFSEEDAWLPPWLQQCNGEQLNVGSIKEDHITFKQRVEELQFLHERIRDGESFREGGCNIGPLFISGTDSSPLSFAQSADKPMDDEFFNVQDIYLQKSIWKCDKEVNHLLANHGLRWNIWSSLSQLCNQSAMISGDTTRTNDALQMESNCHFISQPLETSGVLCQKDVNLSFFQNACTVSWSPTVDLERPVNKNELLKQEENMNFSEVAVDAVELCITASEALVINQLIESDSLAKPCSPSAILEASLQVKQARLEVWKNTVSNPIHIICEMDNLSDLDDMAMEIAYEDAGIQFSQLPGNQLSVSQVKDTFESEYDENLNHEKTCASAAICGKSYDYSYTHRMEGVIDNSIQVQKDLAAECFGGDTQQKVIGKPVCGLGANVGYFNDCLRTVDTQENLLLSVSAEKGDASKAEKNSYETDVISSPVMSCRDGGKDHVTLNIAKEQFQSRWLGGWTSNNEVRYFMTVNHRIPEPFAAETSFLSESADAAPDENSFVKNHDKEAIIASQLSIPSENFSNRAKDEMLLSQDVRSSSTSLGDPLCSVVPCSISENISSPAVNHEETVRSGNFDITIECENDKMVETSHTDNSLAQAERIAVPTANIKELQNKVSRRLTSLRHYSKMMTSHTDFVDGHQKKSFMIDNNAELTFQETSFTNCKNNVEVEAELPVLQNEDSPTRSPVVNRRTQCHFQTSSGSMHIVPDKNSIGTALPESKIKCLPSENLQRTVLQCKNQSAQKLPSSKLVHFSEQETSVADDNKLQKVQTASETCCSGRAARKPTRFSENLDSGVQQIGIVLKRHLDKEKKRLIFQNMDFLLTGFSKQKEKEIEGLIRRYGGIVLSQIPSRSFKGKRSSRFKSRALPIVLCLKKIQSFKFLYGCAVNAHVLKVNWLIDSIAAGFVLPPKRYKILSRNNSGKHDQVYTAVEHNTHSLVFDNLGIMLHGKTKYLTNIATIIKVFKTLQRLVQSLEAGNISMGVVVADEESCASRHLKQCASEQNILMTSVYWIIKSLYAGRFILLEEKKNSRRKPAIKLQRRQDSMELSQEI